MPSTPAWLSRTLLFGGLLAVVVGTLDPLEGSVIILGGFGLVAIAAHLEHSRHRLGLDWSVLLVGAGVAAMFILSAYGGVGGRSGHSPWWALTMVPYPVGWIIGIIESVRLAKEQRVLREA